MSAPAPPPPPGFEQLVSQLERHGYVLQKIPPNPGAVVDNSPVPDATNQASKPPALRRRGIRDPNRPNLELQWCVHPGGTPGRGAGGFNLQKALGLTNEGYSMVRRDIKHLLIADDEINTNKALTNNNPDAITNVCYQALGLYPEFEIFRKQSLWPLKSFVQMILKTMSDKYNGNQLALRKQAAQARGEVFETKKHRTAPPTTARGKAALKAMKEKTAKSKASGGTPPPINPTQTASGEGNEPGADKDGEGNAAMDISFQQPVDFDTLEDEREGAVEGLVGDLSSMSIDPSKDTELEADDNFTLFQPAPQAESAPLPERTSESRLTTTSSIPPDTRSASITSDVAPAAPCKVPRPKAAYITPPDSAHPTPRLPISALPEATGPSPAAPSTSSKSSGSATKQPNPPTKTPSTDDISTQVAKIGHLASMLGEAQRAALPPELLAALNVLTSSAPTRVSPTKGAPPDDDESELSSPESASSDNPPLANQRQKPCQQSKVQGGSNTVQNWKAPANSGKSGPVVARTAQAIKAAKAAQGVEETTEVDEAMVPAPPPGKAARGREKGVTVGPNAEDKVPLRKTTREICAPKRW